MLKAFIVEDEPLARDELKYLLMESKQIEIVGEAGSLVDAVKYISKQKPDLVFLDIDLDGDNGLDLAKQLLMLNPTPAIVFATAYDEYALQAFELNAIDYILKPFDEDRIRQTLEKIIQIAKIGTQKITITPSLKKASTDKIAVLVDERIVLLENDSIIYLESFEGKCKIKTMTDEYLVNDSLVVIEKKLQHPQFMRVHRSFIVNLDHIVEIHPWFNSTYNLVLKDKSKVPVSRTYIKEFKMHVGF
ncbi:LytTR family DNA-binding domain-containing protein [Psychrobacillus sp. NEAU-3TGS]|uniref:LytR/AlgR family response regulator transcription factor n=1 Tax=Psychrobacillus sp. NEAU-3TGS TaxID=2995412 RepID=UPI002499119E|nr:LytTR family DNA-binding domain-containing protein [Psychrobacillus sp. NEAU-3TGS]MDI2589706.1 LytTR family DNA-binding domain-containing protein [Psychrobacillus sp. NEAU-3TGS]